MASHDHTARACHVVRNEPKSESTSLVVDVPCHPAGAKQDLWLNCECQQAITALALMVIHAILNEHHKCKHTSLDVKRVGLLPLNPVQRIGLKNAIELLHHYANTLTPNEGG